MTAPSWTEHLFRLSTDADQAADELEGTDALRLVEHLQRSLSSTQARQVARCRKAGVSWSAIAAALDVTKQGAHQRYGD